MRIIFSLLIVALLSGCTTPTPYTWKDTREQGREDFSADLEKCRNFTARQYKPGVPTGEPYLEENPDFTEGGNENSGEWRPDRSPFKTTNVNSLPRHDIPVDYTGYPGELDYYPDYLDDILEKCMQDHGWDYQPDTEN